MNRPTSTLTLMAALAIVAAACSTADTGTDTTEATAATTTTEAPASTTTEAPMSEPVLSLDLTGFPELQTGVHYEGWAIIDGAPVTTGKFNVVDGEIRSLSGNAIDSFAADGLHDATTIVITIEPSGDTDDIPSDTHFVAGDVVDGAVELSIAHPAALGTDFSSAEGTVILATPTNGEGTDEFSGIWFLNLPDPSPSLVLPTLPAGWKYEGWAVIDGVPVTSGTFTDVASADDSAPFSGPEDGPPFPGEDFLSNAPDGVSFPTDLRGGVVVVSVEPDPDDSPAPFALKPLVGMVPSDAGDHQNLTLDNAATDLPGGTGTIG